jgi:hypothetical protein
MVVPAVEPLQREMYLHTSSPDLLKLLSPNRLLSFNAVAVK